MWSNWLPELTAARVTRWAFIRRHAQHEQQPADGQHQTGSDIFVASAVPTSACFQSQKADQARRGAVGEVVLAEANARHSMPRMARMPKRRLVRRSWKNVRARG